MIVPQQQRAVDLKDFEILRSIPFIMVHLLCFCAFLTGWSWIAVGTCAFLYFIRMFAITGVYHRYFSHRSYKTSRPMQFVLACMGSAAVQKGPLWWAANHRHHHRHSDTETDVHSPILHGIWWSHVGWITAKKWTDTKYSDIKDFAKFPELMFLNKWDNVVPVCLAVSCFLFGFTLNKFWPGLGTSGWQMLVWGFFISTTVLYHGTFCINSFCHILGTKRYKTGDDSRNSWLMALITLGEGWHNNHHFYPGAERQGHFWWEFDITHYCLTTLSWTGLIWDLHAAPKHLLKAGQLKAIREGIVEEDPVRTTSPTAHIPTQSIFGHTFDIGQQ